MNWRSLVAMLALLIPITTDGHAGNPMPEDRLGELRALLDTLEPGTGCVTLEEALVNSNLSLDSALPIGLDPAAQTEAVPAFSGFNLFAQVLGEREDHPEESIRVMVSLVFAYVPDTYTGWPAISTDAPVDRNPDEPSVSVYVDAFLSRPNRRTEQRQPFRFNPSGDIYLQAVRQEDIVEYRTAFDFSVESRSGEVIRASGAIAALQDFETQMGITPTPAEEASSQIETSVLPCPMN